MNMSKRIEIIQHVGPEVPNGIFSYVHCAKCLKIKPDGVSPASWALLEVGLTPTGVQVRCVRHNENVVRFEVRLADEAVQGS